tara:strand:+ start:67 stop:216 length:150 start_codon:yes stop_codon:yes gene_type:complete
MNEIDRYKSALEKKEGLLQVKFKMHEVLTEEIKLLKIDIIKMRKILNGR